MLKKGNYLTKKINKLKENIKFKKREKNVNSVKRFFSIATAIGLASFAILNWKYTLLVRLASGLALMGSELFLIYASAVKESSNSIEYDEKQINHLQNIKNNGIKSNKNLDQKRLERISEYEEQQEQLEQEIKNVERNRVIAGGLTGAASIGTIFNPVVGGVLSIIGLIFTHNLSEEKFGKNDEFNLLECRINNLKNDIELGSIYGYDNKSLRKPQEKSQTSTKGKQNTKQEEITIEKKSDNQINQQNEQKVNAYLSYLNSLQDKSNPKQYSKH